MSLHLCRAWAQRVDKVKHTIGNKGKPFMRPLKSRNFSKALLSQKIAASKKEAATTHKLDIHGVDFFMSVRLPMVLQWLLLSLLVAQ